MKRKGIIAIVFLLLLSITTACSSNSDFGKNYIQATLDTSYKGIFTEYMKLTDSTEEEAREVFEHNLFKEAEYFQNYIAEAYFSDEDWEDLIAFYTRLYAEASYTTRAVSRDGDDYLVEVKINPITNIYDNYEAILEFDEEFFTRYENGEFDGLDDDELGYAYSNGILALLNENITEVTYGEEVSHTIRVSKDSDGLYSFSDTDWQNIDYDIIQY